MQQGPPPQRRPGRVPEWVKRGIAWVGGGTAFLATLVSLILGVRALLAQGDEQLKTLTRIEARLAHDAESDKKRDAKLDELEQKHQKHEVYSEKSFATLFAALAKEGYQTPRGAPEETAQVEWQPTKNARKPLKPVGQDGTELVLPAVR